ncbi:MAG: hypothetical protein V1737_02590 [Chloroflexota bacterium]
MDRKVTRIFTGPDGQSHFEDMDLPMSKENPTRGRTEATTATSVYFLEFSPGYERSWHHAPQRQMVVTLQGEGEVQIGDGTRRRFGPGDIMLAEDKTGQGHFSHVVSKVPRKMMVVTLE